MRSRVFASTESYLICVQIVFFYHRIIGIAVIKREVESGSSSSQGLLCFKELRFEFSFGSDMHLKTLTDK